MGDRRLRDESAVQTVDGVGPRGTVTLQVRPFARSPQVLAQLRLCILASPLARDLAVRVPRDIAAGWRRAQQAACVGRRAIADAAQQVSVLVSDHAAASFRTAEFAVGVHTAVASSA